MIDMRDIYSTGSTCQLSVLISVASGSQLSNRNRTFDALKRPTPFTRRPIEAYLSVNLKIGSMTQFARFGMGM
jgi:hypothetical protein